MKNKLYIAEPKFQRDSHGSIQRLDLSFGPNHFIHVYVKDGRLLCDVGSTHRGVTLDATDIPGDFDKAVYALEAAFPNQQTR